MRRGLAGVVSFAVLAMVVIGALLPRHDPLSWERSFNETAYALRRAIRTEASIGRLDEGQEIQSETIVCANLNKFPSPEVNRSEQWCARRWVNMKTYLTRQSTARRDDSLACIPFSRQPERRRRGETSRRRTSEREIFPNRDHRKPTFLLLSSTSGDGDFTSAVTLPNHLSYVHHLQQSSSSSSSSSLSVSSSPQSDPQSEYAYIRAEISQHAGGGGEEQEGGEGEHITAVLKLYRCGSDKAVTSLPLPRAMPPGWHNHTRGRGWDKVSLIMGLLASPEYSAQIDFVLWLDHDTVISEPSLGPEWLALFNKSLVIGADHHGLNSGVFLLRNDPWSRHSLLPALWGMWPRPTERFRFEQGPLQFLAAVGLERARAYMTHMAAAERERVAAAAVQDVSGFDFTRPFNADNVLHPSLRPHVEVLPRATLQENALPFVNQHCRALIAHAAGSGRKAPLLWHALRVSARPREGEPSAGGGADWDAEYSLFRRVWMHTWALLTPPR